MKIRLLLSYKGTHFFGWQKQKNQQTIQEELEKTLEKIFKKKINVAGSGRTDAGVHAIGQEAHFEIDQGDLRKIDLVPAINSFISTDISVLRAWEAPEDFHARFSAQKKIYQFFIFMNPVSPALFREYVWWVKRPLCFKKLQKMAKVFKGTQDFKSFQSSGSDVDQTIKTIYSSRWIKRSSDMYCYEIQGSGFLKQMVRNIVGTQIGLLKEKKPEEILKSILKCKDRRKALGPAPGQGLYLKEVFYPSVLDRQCISL